MSVSSFRRAGAVTVLCLGLNFTLQASAQAPSPSSPPPKPKSVNVHRAAGTFEVNLVPLPPDEKAAPANIGRLSIDKQIHGDLEGTTKGEMMVAGTDVKGSAGYVAMERVTATLDGKKGTFVLQHSGIMNRGVPELSVTVVPDSGTGELVGLAGTFSVQIADGKHSYEFEYSLPDKP